MTLRITSEIILLGTYIIEILVLTSHNPTTSCSIAFCGTYFLFGSISLRDFILFDVISGYNNNEGH